MLYLFGGGGRRPNGFSRETELIVPLGTYGSFGILLVLVVLSAFFSASETALMSANRVRLRTLAEAGDARAARALALDERYDRTLSAILIGNNLVNIAASSVATVAAIRLFGVSGGLIATVFTTVVILTFGEILPKSFAKERADRLLLSFSGALRALTVALAPLALLFVCLQRFALRLAGKSAAPLVTEEELRTIIETSEEEGVLDEQRSELMRSALQFDETTVQEVLTPRVDLVAIDVDGDPAEIRETILAERFSRIPVYEKDLDHILGILQTRDYLEALLTTDAPDLRPMLTQPLFAPRTQPIAALLAAFKKERRHMAVVLDDYGGTMGIVSMEDLLEELVGEIYDEDEEAEIDFVTLPDGSFRISGDYPVEDALERIGYEERGFETEAASLGGWVIEQLGRIPREGDEFSYHGLAVRVDSMDDRRIGWVTVRLPAEEPDAAEKRRSPDV